MACDGVELAQRLAQPLCCLLGKVLVAGAMEAIPPYHVLVTKLMWQPVRIRHSRHGLVEGGVKHTHLRANAAWSKPRIKKIPFHEVW